MKTSRRQEFDQIEHDQDALALLALIKSSHMHVGAVASTIDINEARRNLEELRQDRMSLPEYCQKVDKLLDICTSLNVPGMDDHSVIHRFLIGANDPDLDQEVNRMIMHEHDENVFPASLEEAKQRLMTNKRALMQTNASRGRKVARQTDQDDKKKVRWAEDQNIQQANAAVVNHKRHNEHPDTDAKKRRGGNHGRGKEDPDADVCAACGQRGHEAQTCYTLRYWKKKGLLEPLIEASNKYRDKKKGGRDNKTKKLRRRDEDDSPKKKGKRRSISEVRKDNKRRSILQQHPPTLHRWSTPTLYQQRRL